MFAFEPLFSNCVYGLCLERRVFVGYGCLIHSLEEADTTAFMGNACKNETDMNLKYFNGGWSI